MLFLSIDYLPLRSEVTATLDRRGAAMIARADHGALHAGRLAVGLGLLVKASISTEHP